MVPVAKSLLKLTPLAAGQLFPVTIGLTLSRYGVLFWNFSTNSTSRNPLRITIPEAI
jgi:hypothetical protein